MSNQIIPPLDLGDGDDTATVSNFSAIWHFQQAGRSLVITQRFVSANAPDILIEQHFRSLQLIGRLAGKVVRYVSECGLDVSPITIFLTLKNNNLQQELLRAWFDVDELLTRTKLLFSPQASPSDRGKLADLRLLLTWKRTAKKGKRPSNQCLQKWRSRPGFPPCDTENRYSVIEFIAWANSQLDVRDNFKISKLV